MALAQTILVVDDEPTISQVVASYLRRDGFRAVTAADGPSAVEAAMEHRPDLVVLDVMLPGFDGLQVMARLRQERHVPVILLTARGEESDRVIGLRLGADDYVVKPFSSAELVARIHSVLRRAHREPTGEQRLEFAELAIDLQTREVMLRGDVVDTTAKEFDLLVFLAQAPRRVFSREQILKSVWDSSTNWQDAATVTEHIRRLRKKIEQDPDEPRWLRTVRGVGYRFEP
jgi:DNA-binding response OmpR family regulator